MGEYAKHNGLRIKIGTCESMYYLRFEDRLSVKKEANSLDPATEKNLFWRLPFPDEDSIQPGRYDQYNRAEVLHDFSDAGTAQTPGTMQMHHPTGLLLNINCYHGEKLPEASKDFRPRWNGKGSFFELAFIKNAGDSILPVIRCRACGGMWSYSSWDDILPKIHNKALKERLERYVPDLSQLHTQEQPK